MSLDTAQGLSQPDSQSLDDALTKQQSSATFLTTGTAVSAKYRGAYCEATVDQVTIKFKLRVQLKTSKNVVSVDQNDLISGDPAPGCEVVVRISTSVADGTKSSGSSLVERVGTVLRVADTSLYTVVFDDGDKRTLRRTQLVIKGERHFKESESLDCLPLTNPEQFRQPVIDRKKLPPEDNESDDGDPEDSISDNMDPEPLQSTSTPTVTIKPESTTDHFVQDDLVPALDSHPPHECSDSASVHQHSSEELSKIQLHASTACHRLLGRVVLVDMPVSAKDHCSSSTVSADSTTLSTSSAGASDNSSRRRFTPGLVVLPSAMPGLDLRPVSAGPNKSAKVPVLLVRSFKDNRFMPVPLCYLKRLKRPTAVELAHSYSSLRTAFERAILWLDCYELPASWGENATQTLLGAKDWRSARRHVCRGHTHSSSEAKPSDPISDGHRDPRCRRPAVRRNTSTPKRLLTSKSSTSLMARKRALASITIKKADAKRVNKRLASTSSGSPTKKRARAAKQTGRLKKRSPPTRNRSNSASSSDGSSDSHASSAERSTRAESAATTSSSSDSESSDGSSSSVDFEARDRWIAQLYRFMDEGGAPINKAPSLANKDLDLYKLYKLVRQHGGFHRVTAQLKWGYIYSKLGLPHNFSAGPRNLQAAFKRYLYPLDDISRKLGTELDALPLSRPRNATAYNSSFATATPRAATASSARSAPTVPKQTESKATEKSPPPSAKPVLTANDNSSAERSRHDPVQVDSSSPPVLSPPVLSGHTPPPPPQLALDEEWPSGLADVMERPRVSLHKLDETISEELARIDSASRKPKDLSSDSTPIKSVSKPTSSRSAVAKSQSGRSSSSSASSSASSLSGCSRGSSSRSKSRKPGSLVSARSQPLLLPFPEYTRISSKQVIPVGSRVRVRCGDRVAYEARIVKHVWPQSDVPVRRTGPNEVAAAAAAAVAVNQPTWPSPTELHYRVHYMGWNTRHDEVVARSRIVSVVQWARPIDSGRAPSCSSLSLAAEQPSRSSPSIRPSKSTSPPNGASGCWGSVPMSLDSAKRGAVTAPVDDYDEEQSDHSHQTVSDIVTTTPAPVVVRRHRHLFASDSRHSKRPRTSDAARSSEQRAVGVKREAHSPVETESDPVDKPGMEQSTFVPEQPRNVPSNPKRLKLSETPETTAVQEGTTTSNSSSGNNRKTGTATALAKDTCSKSKVAPPKSVVPKQLETDSKKADRRLPKDTIPTDVTTPKSSQSKVSKAQSKDLKPNAGKSTSTSSPATPSKLDGRKTSKPLIDNHSQSVPARKLDPKPKAGESGRAPRSGQTQEQARRESVDRGTTASTKRDADSPSSVSSSSSTSVERSLSAVSRSQGLSKSLAKSTLPTSGNKSAKVEQPDRPPKRKAETDLPRVVQINQKKTQMARQKKPDSKERNNQSSSDDEGDKSRARTTEKGQLKFKTSIQRSGLKKKAVPSRSADESSSDNSDARQKTILSGKSKVSSRPRPIDRRSSGESARRSSVVPSPRSPNSDRGSSSNSNSGSGDDTSESEDYATTLDALPRLTRNQHRQLLGDTPPGALLQTASPVPPGPTSPNTAIPPGKVDGVQKTEDIAVVDLPMLPANENAQPGKSTASEESKPVSKLSTAATSASVEKVDNSESTAEPLDSRIDRSLDDSRLFAKLRPRQRSGKAEQDKVKEITQESVKLEETTHVDEDEDERSSVRTMSTDPMKDLHFDFNMSPNDESMATSGGSSSSSSSDDSGSGHLAEKDRSASTRKSTANSPKAYSDISESSSMEDRVRQAPSTRKRCRDESSVVLQTASAELPPKPRSVSRASLGNRQAGSSNQLSEPRKPGKRAAPTTPHRSVTFDRSPTPMSESPPQSCRSPPAGTSPASQLAAQPVASSSKPGLSSGPPPQPRLTSAQRRFGGPFYPIPGFDEMSSEMKCVYLQDRMHRILEAWRAAKQFIKDLDQRSNRTRRPRCTTRQQSATGAECQSGHSAVKPPSSDSIPTNQSESVPTAMAQS